MSQNDNQKDVAQNEQQDGKNTNAAQGSVSKHPKKSVPPYPQSGMPPYPQSGMPPYPRSSMPPYPYGMPPYGMSHYIPGQPPKKKMSTVKFAIIFVVLVLVAAVAAVLYIFVFNGSKPGEDKTPEHSEYVVSNNSDTETEKPEEPEEDRLPSYESYSKYKVGAIKADGTVNFGKAQMLIDKDLYPFNDSMLKYENANYVDISVFAELFGIGVLIDTESRTAALTVNGNEFVITHDKNECVKTKPDGTTSNVAINRPAILFDNGRMFVAVKGLSGIFDLKSVLWDDENGCVKLVTKSVKIP